MPVAFTSIITSPALGPASSTSAIVSGLLFSNATAARVFMAILLGWLELCMGPCFSQHHDKSPSWANAHAIRSPLCEKRFKYRLKSITQRSLTEIDPCRKSAAARKNLFPGNGFLRAVPSQNQLWEDCYGEGLNSSGSGQRREGRF